MQAPASVCPGYKHVEAFSNDDDYYEGEEEVSYVTLDLGDVEPQLVPSASTYRLIGLDTPTPYLQLHGTTMKGRQDLLLGTEMIFTEDRENHDWNKRSLVHVANTGQRVAFQEVTLIPKNFESKSEGKQKAAFSSEIAEEEGGEGDPLAEAAAGITTSHFLPPSTEDHAAEIDKLTGVTGPLTRVPRKKKGKASAARSSSKPTKESSRKKATKSPKAKGKEKEKEVSPSSEMDVQMDDDAIGEDNLEDVYMEHLDAILSHQYSS